MYSTFCTCPTAIRLFLSNFVFRVGNIFFLIDEDQKIAHMDISFSKDPAAVLRKHIRGEIPETEAIIFRMKMEDIPRMWVWEAGRITRGVALTYLQIWQTVFQSEGYEVIGTLITEEMREGLPQLSGMQKWPLRNVGVESLLHGKIAKRIESENAGRDRRSALQKFTVDATDEVMRIRVKENTAYRFRCFCKEKGITQNQGLELFLGDYTDIVEPLIMDLQKRLEKANSELEKKEQEKEKLREALRKAEEGKEYPKIIQAAKLQNQLLCELIKQLPIPDLDGKEMLWRYSSKQGTRLFPEGKEYSCPEKEGVIDVNVEHMQYSKRPSVLFISFLPE